MEAKNTSGIFGNVDILVILVSIIWGLNYVVVKIALREIEPMLFNCYRYIIGALVCWTILLIKEKDLSISRKHIWQFALAGIVANGFNQIFFIYGVSKTTAGATSLILASTPACVALLANILKLERNNIRTWIGIIVSFLGVTLVVAGSANTLTGGAEAMKGNLLVVLATIFWSIYTIMLRVYFKDLSIIKVTTYAITFTTVFFVLITSRQLINQDLALISVGGWLGVLYSGIFVIGISYVLWNLGIQSLGPTRTATYANLPPFISVFSAWLILGEVITGLQIVGAITIIAGVIYSNKSKSIASTQTLTQQRQS